MAEENKGAAMRSGASLVAVLAAAGSLVSAGLSFWQNRQANEVQREIALKQRESEDAFNAQETKLRQLALDREYQLGVAGRVADALERAGAAPQQVNVASALVYTLPDGELKQKLVVIVLNEAQRAVARGVELDSTVASLRNSVSDSAVAETAAAAPAAAPAPSASVQAEAGPAGKSAERSLGDRLRRLGRVTEMVAKPNAGGWDMEVFYCGAANERKARLAAERLAQASRSGEKVLGEVLGRVRLREYASYMAEKEPHTADQVIIDRGEEALGERIAAIVDTAGAPATPFLNTDGRQSPWYLSVFYCGPT